MSWDGSRSILRSKQLDIPDPITCISLYIVSRSFPTRCSGYLRKVLDRVDKARFSLDMHCRQCDLVDKGRLVVEVYPGIIKIHCITAFECIILLLDTLAWIWPYQTNDWTLNQFLHIFQVMHVRIRRGRFPPKYPPSDSMQIFLHLTHFTRPRDSLVFAGGENFRQNIPRRAQWCLGISWISVTVET